MQHEETQDDFKCLYKNELCECYVCEQSSIVCQHDCKKCIRHENPDKDSMDLWKGHCNYFA